MKNMKKITELGRNKIVRWILNLHTCHPVAVVPGSDRPRQRGESYYHTTPGGKVVRHPSAYHYPAVYHASTLRGEVGEDWDLPAPKGMYWQWETHVGPMLVRASDGMEYHPTRKDILARNFCTRVRRAMAENYKRRVKISRDKREFAQMLSYTRVTLEDSRKAGNCVEGSLAFAERKLGLSRQEVLDAGYLFSVPAKTLWDRANGQRDAVERAIRVAYARETAVSREVQS